MKEKYKIEERSRKGEGENERKCNTWILANIGLDL